MSAAPLTVFAPAKLNLGLEVVRLRRDGYHDLETIFQTIDLGDTLTFRREEGGYGAKLNCTGLPIPGEKEDNLVLRACRIMEKYRPPAWGGLDIQLEKRIPAGSGLGGASSDAAATLLALDRLWRLGLDHEELSDLALRLGSDVPFLLKGGVALGRGRGEILDFFTPLSKGAFLLVFPGFAIETGPVFRQLKMGLTSNAYRVSVEQVRAFLPRFPSDRMILKNRLEDVVFPAHPVMGEIAAALEDSEAVHTLMSGSGSTMFGTYPDRASAQKAALEIGVKWETHVAGPLPHGARLGWTP